MLEDTGVCAFLADAKINCDIIPTVSSKRQSQYDCPICMESTVSRSTIVFSDFTLHHECFRCKNCSVGLHQVEREKIILKRKDGERFQVYCADCRSSTFFDKIKNTSNQQKLKIYNFFKESTAPSTSYTPSSSFPHESNSAAPSGGGNGYLSSSPGNTSIHVSAVPSSPNLRPSYPIIPVKDEIQNFKFNNGGGGGGGGYKRAPAEGLGPKSMSIGRFQTATSKSYQSSHTLPTSASSNHIDVGAELHAINISHSPHAGSLATYRRPERYKPPLPPTPMEKKERAMEQMKIKNMHQTGIDISPEKGIIITAPGAGGMSTHDPQSPECGTPSNTPPKSMTAPIPVMERTRQYSKALPDIPLQISSRNVSNSVMLAPSGSHPPHTGPHHTRDNDIYNQLNNVNRFKRSQIQNNQTPLPPPPKGRPLPTPPQPQPQPQTTTQSQTQTTTQSQTTTTTTVPSPTLSHRTPPVVSPRNILPPVQQQQQSSNNNKPTPSPTKYLRPPSPMPPPQLPPKTTNNNNNDVLIDNNSNSNNSNSNNSNKTQTSPTTSRVNLVVQQFKQQQQQPNNNNNNGHAPMLQKRSGSEMTIMHKIPGAHYTLRTVPKRDSSGGKQTIVVRKNVSSSNLMAPTNSNNRFKVTPARTNYASTSSTSTTTSTTTQPLPIATATHTQTRQLNKYCTSCKEQLSCTTQLVVVKGHYYHRECFNCAKCHLPLQVSDCTLGGHDGMMSYHSSCLKTSGSGIGVGVATSMSSMEGVLLR
ncbi:hypothetical protein SAMD00019534_094470 [Acytostelium subglobosum LB1]|uniref:hypothetical protein n=1 Tax=Acytostelium subglobosum LB1 TaxID=1410327 RepID=UPI000645127B|nr:hypothetical protein SAMD00019534_094470 [Acytostelium subglobosum LB1]GAM26272.1 hypothetical protein SAMD00019534_094470 [Acytostelium subglobosum LB1]|eukprot:XP_012750826.1 hypothetical protein SAMD00019534_094470 [Acytostelium subglobosum LB1]